MGDMKCVDPTDHQTRQSEKACSICCLRPHAKYMSKNVVNITDRKCHDQVSDQELGAKLNVIEHVMGPPTV